MENEDFLEEALIIYDDNTLALAIHISYLSSISRYNKMKSCSRNKIHIKKIEADLVSKKRLDEYKLYFLEIMNSKKGEIESFVDLSKMNLEGLSDILYNIRNIIENERGMKGKVDILDKFEKNCLEINIQSGRILEELKNGR